MKFSPGFFFLVLLFVGMASSAGGKGLNYSEVDVGGYVTNLVQRFNVPSSFAGDISAISGFARFRRGLSIGKGFFFEPSLGALVPWRASNDGNAKTFTFQLSSVIVVPVFRFVSLRLGPGIYSNLFASSAQQVDLNNGSSTTTSAFYNPSGVAISYGFSVEGGLQFHFSHKLSLNLDVYGLAIASTARRTFNAAASLGWTL